MRGSLVLLMLAGFLSNPVSAQSDSEPLGIYYEGDECRVMINPPEGWRFDLVNPRIDGRSAACYPFDQEYYNYRTIIYVWIFRLDSLSFQEFVSRDSISYLQKNPAILFKKKDSTAIANDRVAFILQTSDPGAKATMASVAYLDAGTEILIFELNIAGRMEFNEGQARLKEMVAKLELNIRDVKRQDGSDIEE